MDLEEVRQQQPRLVGQVRSRTVFNLRQVGLAVLLLQLPGDSADALLLGHIAPQAAQIAFYQPQVPEFFAQCHILQIAIYIFQFAIYVKRNRRSEVRMQLVENKIHHLITASEYCSASSVFREEPLGGLYPSVQDLGATNHFNLGHGYCSSGMVYTTSGSS